MSPDGNRAAVLADDTTGALEAGATLAAHSFAAQVCLTASDGQVDAGLVTVFDTDSRHLNNDDAFRRIQTVAALLAKDSIPALYKKTDSTLRGPIGAELAALMHVVRDAPLIYVPAYPQNGRTVRQGCLFIDGVPVHETSFAADLRNPVRTCSVVEVVRAGYDGRITAVPTPEALLHELERQPRGIFVCDGESVSDLVALGSALRSFRAAAVLLAGPVAFLPFWADSIGLSRTYRLIRPKATRLLVACGSRHPASLEQARHGAAIGLEVIRTPEAVQSDPDAVAGNLADRVAERVTEANPDALVVFGGDTLAAICRRLNWKKLRSVGEFASGVSISAADQADILVIAKAGGFGPADLLSRLKEHLFR